jgi:hypothetical protein
MFRKMFCTDFEVKDFYPWEESMEPYDVAQEGLKQLKQAVIALLRSRPEGLRNVEIASTLGIRSDHDGKQEDYLSYSVLGLLMRSGVVIKTDESTYKLFAPERN